MLLVNRIVSLRQVIDISPFLAALYSKISLSWPKSENVPEIFCKCFFFLLSRLPIWKNLNLAIKKPNIFHCGNQGLKKFWFLLLENRKAINDLIPRSFFAFKKKKGRWSGERGGRNPLTIKTDSLTLHFKPSSHYIIIFKSVLIIKLRTTWKEHSFLLCNKSAGTWRLDLSIEIGKSKGDWANCVETG